MKRSIMKKIVLPLLLAITCFAFTSCSEAADKNSTSEIVPGIPVKNTVTMVDLGATTCVPCKLMAPILEELKEVYKGRSEIIFIDVWDKDNKGKAQKFAISMIPTQIFYDKTGKEVYRHSGFMDKEAIVTKLDEILAN